MSKHISLLCQECQNWLHAGLLPCKKIVLGLGDFLFFFFLFKTINIRNQNLYVPEPHKARLGFISPSCLREETLRRVNLLT